MDITRIQHLAGILTEGVDITDKIKTNKVVTTDKTEALTNQIVQGKSGDVQVSDETKTETKPTVPKDVKQGKPLGLKEAFNRALVRP